MIVGKAWGYENVLVNEEYCGKRLHIYANSRSSLHYHNTKKETFIVELGVVRLEQRDERGAFVAELLYPGDVRTLEPKTPHRFSSVHGATILEISTHHDDADVVRLEPSGKLIMASET